MKKNFVPVFIFGFFLLILALRLTNCFLIRSDQGPVGELFMHKLAGIALLAAAVSFLRIKWAAIGFKKDHLLRGILTGITIGGISFLVAYAVELIIAVLQGKSPSLQFYTTSYNTTGNTRLGSGILFILICITGNIVNVIMENGIFNGLFISTAEKRYSFAKANVVFSSLLFGLWHIVMPFRNFIDGNQSLKGTIVTVLMLFGSSFLFSVMLGMQFKQASSLWDGMTVHFINNVSVNLLHVVHVNSDFAAGTESEPTLRIAIAQALMFTMVTIRWLLWRKKKSVIYPHENCERRSCYASPPLPT